MTDLSPNTNDKTARIISASFEAFRLYGFKRVSMADIAKGAGMSRAALYLHFRNKEDIFASLVADYFARTAQVMEEALRDAPDAQSALKAAFAAKVAPPFDALLNSPHGPELLDAKAEVSGEIVAEGDAKLVSVLTVWLATGLTDGSLTLGASAREVARVILAAVHGVVDGATEYTTLRDDLDRLAVMFARALTP
ncbi:MAG TPA: TetR/AcrR family transcriptional regulator [Maritimibacter sp.]|nr:TetR/AcrR family transcriptional regulator [Maritimibacter sp.]